MYFRFATGSFLHFCRRFDDDRERNSRLERMRKISTPRLRDSCGRSQILVSAIISHPSGHRPIGFPSPPTSDVLSVPPAPCHWGEECVPGLLRQCLSRTGRHFLFQWFADADPPPSARRPSLLPWQWMLYFPPHLFPA